MESRSYRISDPDVDAILASHEFRSFAASQYMWSRRAVGIDHFLAITKMRRILEILYLFRYARKNYPNGHF